MRRIKKPSGADESAVDADRFGNVVEDLAMKFAAVGPSEQNGLQVSIAISHQQARRYATAYAPNCTIAMHLAATGVHDTEMAFCVDDLASQRDRAEHYFLCVGNRTGVGTGRKDLDHPVAWAFDKRARQAHSAGTLVHYTVLPGRDQ